MKKYFGDKAFYLTTLSIALPIMAQQFITTFVNLIDNIMIGNIGSTALTAVTVSNRIYLLFNSTLFGFCGAACIFIAQYYGAKNKEKCQKILDMNIIVTVLMALLFMVGLIFIPRTLLGFFATDEAVLALSEDYTRIALYTYVPYAISYSIMMALRSVGENKIQMIIGSLTVLINTTLNYILIFGHFGFNEMGVEGAAIATLIARVFEMIAYLYLLKSHKYLFHLKVKEMFRFDIPLLQLTAKKALPLTVNEIMFSLGMAIIFISYVRCDESLIASVSVADTVKQIMFIIFGGLSSAISIMIGNRLGANEIEEAKNNAYKLITFGVIVSVIIGSIFFIIAPVIAMMYNVEPVIKEMIVYLIRIKAICLPLYVYNVCIFFILRAGGDTVSTVIIDSIPMWFGPVLVSTVLSVFFELPLILLYIIVEACDALKLFLCYYYFKKGNWAKNITV